MQEQAWQELNAGVDPLWIHIATTDKKRKKFHRTPEDIHVEEKVCS
jgi:hypothetical protein